MYQYQHYHAAQLSLRQRRLRTHTHALLSTHTTTHNMPLGRRAKRKGKDELRWSWVVARATCPLHERLRVGDDVELQLLEMDDKIDKMDK